VLLPIVVAFGSETGNSEALAERTAEAICALGLPAPVEVVDLAELEPEILPHLHTFIVLTSTFGDGDPPANAQDFHGWLMGEAPALPQLGYSVCALGDRAYPRFCQCGRDLDARLGALGARPLAPRVDCDADYEPPWEGWLATLTEGLRAVDWDRVPAPDPELVEWVEAGTGAHAVGPAPGTRKNPYLATVRANRNLNGEGSAKETRFISLAVDPAVVDYRAGDALGVFPRNCPDLARRVLMAAGIPRAEPVEVDGEWLTARDALIHRRDLNLVDRRLLALCGFDALLADDAARHAYVAEHHVIDALQAAGRALESAALMAALRPLKPRLYSISSSPAAHPREIHLTVDVLRYELHGESRKGVCSTFFAERAGPGVEVPVFLQRSTHFHLPSDETHLIMVGPGTGVAPFRGFLQARAARAAQGHAWLFFGARHAACDFLYREELEAWLADETLSRLDTAFSRDQAHKVYVQDRLREAGDHLFAWLQAGACVYVCGDASRMAKDVHQALLDVLREWGGLTPVEAAAALDTLAQEGRYRRDVY
jgi:sulfite reductase (NADPH) flavoprotein alpha-component